MTHENLKTGTGVIVHLPDGDTAKGEVVDGPVFKDNKAVFKIRHSDFDNLYPAGWIKPLLRPIL